MCTPFFSSSLATMSTSTSFSDEASVSSGARLPDLSSSTLISPFSHQPQKPKRKRGLPGNPDPDAEVIALSPKSLMTTNRFVCEVCNKGFQRDQNLQLHRRGHNLPWKLKQRNSKDVRKRVYVCPEPSCVHHHPSRALGDLTGIKKHFSRKHGEKVWKCDKCSKRYAVQSDWKAHVKTCGTREYRCDCGTLFSRKDSFVTHRAFCDALAEESARIIASASLPSDLHPARATPPPSPLRPTLVEPLSWAAQPLSSAHMTHLYLPPLPPPPPPQPAMSATALLQKAAAAVGPLLGRAASFDGLDFSWRRGTHEDQGMTRDFLGVTAAQPAAASVPGLLTFATTTTAAASAVGTGPGVGPGRFGLSYESMGPIMKQPISAFGLHFHAWSDY